MKKVPLDTLHRKLGGKMVPFADYEMPVHYEGIIAEHLHTRNQASLFDVSHMGQAILRGENPARAIETLVCGDIQNLGAGKIRYTLLTNDAGGILDDLMVTNNGDHLFLVVNAACKKQDLDHISAALESHCQLDVLSDRALLALQGPMAAGVLSRAAPEAAEMAFMSFQELSLFGMSCFVTRSGYTGEDGYEISVANEEAETLALRLLDQPEVAPAGLGARDSLRLEAGLCLYGSDIDTTTTPIEAGLSWTISKRRRAEGGFPGADVILKQIADGVEKKRVGIRLDGKAPVRAHAEIRDENDTAIGEVTSGGYAPSLGEPIAMGYVKSTHTTPGIPLGLMVRGKCLPGRICGLPFVQNRYYKKAE
jgi:aminomethyltransferase